LRWSPHSSGAEPSYILEKEVTLKINGQPDRTLKAGDSFQLPVDVVHDACTSIGVKILTVHIIEKGKPLASPPP
jgi:quercetin dioxygenase-like cupin family protein